MKKNNETTQLGMGAVSGLACECGNQIFTHRHSNWIECTACNKIQVLQALHIHDVSGRSEQCNHKFERVERGGECQGYQCDCGEWEDLT